MGGAQGSHDTPSINIVNLVGTRLLTPGKKRLSCCRQCQDFNASACPITLFAWIDQQSPSWLQIAASVMKSLFDDDGEIHRRIRLQRPLEKLHMLEADYLTSHWETVEAGQFAEAWNAEVAELPELEASTMHIVTGLLLPIWGRLPKESSRVYRLQTDAGERVIGRKVSAAWAAAVTGVAEVKLAPSDAWRMLLAGEAGLELAEGQTLKRVRSMNDWRIELLGFNDLGVERLKSMGLISEIVSWKLKLYVPAGAAGADVFERLIDRFPIARVLERKAA